MAGRKMRVTARPHLEPEGDHAAHIRATNQAKGAGKRATKAVLLGGLLHRCCFRDDPRGRSRLRDSLLLRLLHAGGTDNAGTLGVPGDARPRCHLSPGRASCRGYGDARPYAHPPSDTHAPPRRHGYRSLCDLPVAVPGYPLSLMDMSRASAGLSTP